MRLYLYDKDRYKLSFLSYVKKIMSKLSRKKCNRKKELLNAWTIYLNDLNILNKGDSVEKLINKFTNYLVFVNLKDEYVIEINQNIYYNKNIKYIDLYKLINYGNLEMQGCFILSDIFEEVQDNLELYYKAYSNPFKYSKVVKK